MKKTILLFMLVGGIFLIYISFTQKATIVNGLSPRAKEYISQKKKQQDILWTNVNFEDAMSQSKKEHEQPTNELIKNECYQVKIQYPVENINKPDVSECSLYVKLVEPNVRIIISHRTFSSNNYADVPDIAIRRTRNKEYFESKKIVQNREYIVFKKKGDGYEKTAFSFFNNNIVSITISSHYAKNYDYMVDEVLEGFEYLL